MTHKIKSIPKSVCYAEQKICYNYCFSLWHDCRDINDVDKIEWAFEFVRKDLFRRGDMDKYDKDLIYELFKKNFEKYIKSFFIASNYESIGKFFVLKEG